ncbi:MAG: hypothetical protein OXF79_00540 [Chloroflexi bacterium]|nr:hypothetical protein [Chloroflexota bacterium]
MAKPAFRRGLQQEFVDRLNHMYRCGGWWSNLVDDDELFLAIRDDYINFYFRGCSVLKLSWLSKKKEITGEIHYKYLLKPSIKGSPYIKFRESRLALREDLRSMFLDGLDDANELKRAVARYADAEKEGVHDVVMRSENPNVVDLEIAIRDDKSSPRVDLAAVHEDTRQPGTVKLVFYEAKHFKNKELRSSTDQIRVVDQMNNYSDLIINNHDALHASYRQVCCNLFSLEGVGRQNSERHRILRDIATESKELKIDDQPRLIAFGFDQDQQEGKNWKPHAAKLKNALGKERTLFAGEARNIRLEKR